MHFSINAHAVQGFSLKQVRACLRLEPLSLKLNGSRCGLAYGLPCGLLYVLLYGFLYGLLCGLLYSLLRELLYGLLCSVRHAFPLLLPLTSVFNTDFSPGTGARAQRRAAIYSFGNENEHKVENVGLGARFLDPLIYVMIMSFELNSEYCTHDGFSCGPGLRF